MSWSQNALSSYCGWGPTNALRSSVSRVMIPALKVVLAARYRDDTWLAPRPPLMALSPQARAERRISASQPSP